MNWINEKFDFHRLLFLKSKNRDIFNNEPSLLKENDNIPNELGIRESSLKNRSKWKDTLASLINAEETSVEMSWLNNDTIKRGYLKKQYVNLLFESETGMPKNDNLKVKKGKKLVFLLKDNNNKHIAYLKFYPDYPLRQQAVDDLCLRLSGYSCMNTLVKLKHSKRPDICHPVLISEPIGIENKETFDHWNRNINEIDSNLDSFLFSWKFIETYLIQPRDDKGDNLSVNKLTRNNKYYLVAIDSDLTFGYKILNLKEEPNTYSLIYLLNAMNNKLNPAVIQMYLNLDLDKVIMIFI